MTSCWRCGRGTNGGCPQYVFGPVCNRADCVRVRQAISPRFKWFWFRASLPDGESMGRVGSFDLSGEYNYPRGMYSMPMGRRIEADRCLDS